MKKASKYVKKVALPYEVKKVDDEWVLTFISSSKKSLILKKLLAHSEDCRDREAVLKIKYFENEL